MNSTPASVLNRGNATETYFLFLEIPPFFLQKYTGPLQAWVRDYIRGYIRVVQVYILDFQGGFLRFWENRSKMATDYTGSLQAWVQGYIRAYMKSTCGWR